MKIILPAVLFLFLAVTSLANENIAAPSKQMKEPKYSEIKKMSDLEINQALKEYIGTHATWRNRSPLINKIKNFFFLKKKIPLRDEAKSLSYVYARKTQTPLTQYVLTAQRSQHPEIRSTIVTIQGEKKLALDSYLEFPKNRELGSMLYFFKTLDYGDTGFENKKFIEFVFGFEKLARSISTAYQASKELNMPMVLEFESSALIKQSPLTRLFYDALINRPEQLLKVEATPDNGRLISIHPFYAKKIAENIRLFSDLFQKRVQFARNKMMSDKTVRQGLVNLIRNGEGMSGIFYTDEKIVEVVLNDDSQKKILTCSQLFR